MNIFLKQLFVFSLKVFLPLSFLPLVGSLYSPKKFPNNLLKCFITESNLQKCKKFSYFSPVD